jgi:cysteine-S-conjugate beta-lyase
VSGEALLRYLEAVRDLLQNDAARHLLSITMVKPEATYHAWLDCWGAGLDDAFTFFLTRATIAFRDGATFGKPDTAHARLNLGTPRALLTAGLERLRTALAAR